MRDASTINRVEPVRNMFSFPQRVEYNSLEKRKGCNNMARKGKFGTLIKVATAVAPFVYNYYKKNKAKKAETPKK